MKRFLAFVIIPQKTSEVKKFKISIHLFFLLTLILGGVLAGIGWVYYDYFTLRDQLFDLEKIRAEVESQEKDLVYFKEKLTDLNLEYDYLEREATKLRKLTNAETANNSPTGNQEFLKKMEKNSSLSILDVIDSDDQSKILGDKMMETKLRNFEEYLTEDANIFSRTPDIWPVKGYVVSGFGFKTDPFSEQTNLNGIVINTKPEMKVVAPANGIVIDVANEELLGNIVKIYHSNNLITKYGYLSSTELKFGDRVKKRDVIGIVGSPRTINSPRLYYEITLNGIPQNPIKYIDKTTNYD